MNEYTITIETLEQADLTDGELERFHDAFNEHHPGAAVALNSGLLSATFQATAEDTGAAATHAYLVMTWALVMAGADENHSYRMDVTPLEADEDDFEEAVARFVTHLSIERAVA